MKKKNGNINIIGVIFIIFILFVFNETDNTKTYTSTTSTTTYEKNWTEQNNSSMAYVMMRDEFVKRFLKSPSTAKFPSTWSHPYTEFTRYLGNQRYKITSWVDAQNGFGAMIRLYYTGVVKQISKDQWILESFEKIK